jgi:hypothetical protein
MQISNHPKSKVVIGAAVGDCPRSTVKIATTAHAQEAAAAMRAAA